MSYSVHVRRSAEQDVVEAQSWYESQQTGLAATFLVEFAATISILSETPLIYPILYRDVRRAVLHRFPYLVWYRITGSVVMVLACTHGRINPMTVPQRVR